MRRHPSVIPLVLTQRTVSPSSYAPAEQLVETLAPAVSTMSTIWLRFELCSVW
ncbi:MAG: hypothetical protein ACRDTO_06880 [Mycobacterium sp.]